MIVVIKVYNNDSTRFSYLTPDVFLVRMKKIP
jgi:hypothetical protein